MSTRWWFALAAVLLAVASCGGGDDSPALTWLAIGDSFSSGEGTDGAEGDCGQSDGAAAHLAVAELGDRVESLVFAACTGAVIADVERQLDAQGVERFDVVTVTVGGNDAGYANVLVDCLGLDDLLGSALDLFGDGEVDGQISLRDCDITDDELNDRVDALGSQLETLWQRIVDERLTEDGRLVVLGYPSLFADPDEWSDDEGERCDGFLADDARTIRAVAARMNADIERIAEQVGADFVDVAAAFDGHERCSSDPWINGLVFRPRVTGSFHPNDAGHAALADLLVALVGE